MVERPLWVREVTDSILGRTIPKAIPFCLHKNGRARKIQQVGLVSVSYIYVAVIIPQLECCIASLILWRISLRIWKFEIRGKFTENDTTGLEKYWKNEALWMFAKFLWILANPLRIKRMGNVVFFFFFFLFFFVVVFFLLFFGHFLENACERLANTCEYLQMLENDIQTLRLSCKCHDNS